MRSKGSSIGTRWIFWGLIEGFVHLLPAKDSVGTLKAHYGRTWNQDWPIFVPLWYRKM